MKKVTSILLALVMALSVLFCALPALAADNEKAIEAAAAYDRHSIGLKGVKNARELGGYQTTDGRTVKFGKLLRTGKLVKATDEDKEKLIDKYHLTKDIDFRLKEEVALNPDPELDGVEYYNFPAFGASMIDLSSDEGRGYVNDMLQSVIKADTDGNLINTYHKMTYRSFYNTNQGLNAYRNFFQQHLDANGDTVLWHCSSGKDRAGNAAFLLLILLGVDQETAIQDFLNTNYYYEDETEERYEKVYKLTGNQSIANDIASDAGVKREWIELSIKTIMDNFGSYDNYFHKGLGLTDADIQQLRNAYTE